MAKYEILPTIELDPETAQLRSQTLPELVHLDDPATLVMTDFRLTIPHIIHESEPMDEALHEMKEKSVHWLLVVDKENHIIGLIGSDDILGEKPIKLIQERRISREQVLVNMTMEPLDQVTAFDLENIKHARVGNIVNTMQELRVHYALVVKAGEDGNTVVGIFNTSQISRQLHQEITQRLRAESLSELQEKHN